MRISQMANSINMSSLYLNNATNEMNKSAKRIASGKKLNTDLVGEMGKLNSLKGHRNTLNVDTSNLNSAKDFIGVKNGALAQMTELAQKISETYAKGDLDAADNEAIAAYTDEISSILSGTTFNGKNAFNKEDLSFGSYTIEKSALVKDDGSSNLDFSDAAKATTSLTEILKETAKAGANENGINARININTNTATNLDEAISRIEDVDITSESLKYSQHQLQQQIAASMISSMQQSQTSILNYLI